MTTDNIAGISGAQLAELLSQAAGPEAVLSEEPLSKHCTFRIGGPATCYVRPDSERALCETVRVLEEARLPYLVVGKGSNLLFSDEGYDGAVIEIGRAMSECEIEGTTVRAQAGISLSALAKKTAKAGLAGLEFASGIPGTLGGAIYMNAGAYGGQMSDVVRSARVLTPDGNVIELDVASGDFGYRKSPMQEGGIVLDAVIDLSPDEPEAILTRIADLDERRTSKQPLDRPSAGSTFKRPEGHYASALIDQAGLKGWRSGDAAVSEKHAGFVVNMGQATCQDVLDVIRHVTETVEAEYGVTLEPEVRIVANPHGIA